MTNYPETEQATLSGDNVRHINSIEGSAEPALLLIDFDRILLALKRNRWWILGIVAGSLILGAIITMLIVPKYAAWSQVLVEQESDQIIENADLSPVSGYQDADRFLQTQADVIQSRALAARIVAANGLADDAAFFEAAGAKLPEATDLPEVGSAYAGADGLKRFRQEAATDLIQENLMVDLPADSRLVSIGFLSRSPVISARIANSASENLIEFNLARKFDSSTYAREFLGQQLAEAREKLEQSEQELNRYSRQAGLIRIAGQGDNPDGETTLSVTNDSLMQLNQAASAATAERIAAQNRYQAVRNAPLLSIPQVLQNPAVQELIKQRAEIESKLNAEEAIHLAEHPTVVSLRSQLAGINSRINQIGNSIRGSLRLEYESVQQRETSLRSRVSNIRSNALDEQDRGVQYSVLKRVADTDRGLYDTLLERSNQLNATAGATSNNISFISRAEIPRRTDSPNFLLNMIAALFAGLGLAALFTIVREMMDNRISSPTDIAALDLPLLGLIPETENDNITEELADPKSALSEAYASLVANLRYASASGMPRSLAITSARQSEGKSTTALVIATNIALMGRTVLLIDADLRRPTLHQRVLKKDVEGLTKILARESALQEVTQPGPVDGLSLVTGLPSPANPSLLLAGGNLDKLVAESTARYDIVIFDCPPVLGLSDTPTIAQECEGVLMLCDAQSAQMGAVRGALQRLSLINANIIGAVLNRFDPKTEGRAYNSYGSGYYTYGETKLDHE